MSATEPWFLVAAILVAVYFARQWAADWKSARAGKPAPGALPGASNAPRASLLLAAAGAILILCGEIAGEYALGVAQAQSDMTVLFGLYTLAAAFIEELIFRGFLYYDRGSRAQLIASIVGVSIVFAILHPYAWEYEPAEDARWWEVWRSGLALKLDAKAIFSTSVVFLRSLWFYFLRFYPGNPQRSLLPCIVAHLTTNVGVICAKAAQGHLVGLY